MLQITAGLRHVLRPRFLHAAADPRPISAYDLADSQPRITLVVSSVAPGHRRISIRIQWPVSQRHLHLYGFPKTSALIVMQLCRPSLIFCDSVRR